MRTLKQMLRLRENPEEAVDQPPLENIVLPDQQRDNL